MANVAKTVCVYASQEDIDKATQNSTWYWFLENLGGTDFEDRSVQAGLIVTRFWSDKARAEQYVSWLTDTLANLNIVPASLTIEDLPV